MRFVLKFGLLRAGHAKTAFLGHVPAARKDCQTHSRFVEVVSAVRFVPWVEQEAAHLKLLVQQVERGFDMLCLEVSLSVLGQEQPERVCLAAQEMLWSGCQVCGQMRLKYLFEHPQD